MSFDPRRGIRLLDLMVAVFVVAILLTLPLRALLESRKGCEYRVTCSNNMRMLGLALINFSMTHGSFPRAGTFHDDPATHRGDPTKSSIYRAITNPGHPDAAGSWLHSWVVEIMPYLDQPDIVEVWDTSVPYWWPTARSTDRPSNWVISTTHLRVLRCPDVDPTRQSGPGELSYVVNGGFVRWPAVPVGWVGRPVDGHSGSGGVLAWAPPGRPWEETQAVCRKLGVMFPGTHTGDQPWDVKTTPGDLPDGSSETLLVAENTLAGSSAGNRYSGGRPTNWACPLPNFTMFLASDDVCQSPRGAGDCLGGQLAPPAPGLDGPGWSLANHVRTFENINGGRTLTVKGSFPYANGHHPGGANFAFCDGAVRFLSDSIDGTVYAKLVTPAGSLLPPALGQGGLAPDALE